VDGFHADSPGPAERMRYVFTVWFPPQLLLRKEWGECLIRMGILGPALVCFEELELWDNLVYCYRLLDKQAQAMALIKSRLEETPDDPRMWCAPTTEIRWMQVNSGSAAGTLPTRWVGESRGGVRENKTPRR
jgi:hypothetical protein